MTMPRKLTILAATMFATALAGFGLSAAAQDFGKEKESELHKIMEQVQKQNATILKGVRNPVQFKKSQEDVVKAAKELAELGKKAKPHTEPAKEAKEVKDPVEKWNTVMDSFIKEATSFAAAAEKKGADQRETKDAYKKVQATCTTCHDDFRPEDF